MSEADKRFWDLYDKDFTTADKLENIMEELGIEFKDDEDTQMSYLTDEEYEKVLEEFDNRGWKAAPTEEEFIERVIEALREEFSIVESFDDVGVLTRNHGVVVIEGGKNFQLELLGSWH